jgi:hypothetical protein
MCTKTTMTTKNHQGATVVFLVGVAAIVSDSAKAATSEPR